MAQLWIPPRREEPRINPFAPGRLLPPVPRKWGQRRGGGEEPAGTGRGRRAAGGQSPPWGEAGRSRAGGEGRETRSRAGPPAEDASPGPPGAGRRAPWRLLQLVQLLPRAPKWSSGDASAAHLDPLPRPLNLRPQSPEGCLSGARHPGRWIPLPAGSGGYSPRRLRGAGRRRCVRGAGTPGHLGPLWE